LTFVIACFDIRSGWLMEVCGQGLAWQQA